MNSATTSQRGKPFAAFAFVGRADLAAAGALAAVALIYFWPAVTGQAWIPKGGGDLVSFLWPMYSYAAQSLHSSRIPLWNPTQYSGAPFAADNQTGLFYPINLIVFLIAPAISYRVMEWLVFFHVWLAGAAMYTALRLEKLDSMPALAGGIAFMLSDVFVTHVGNLNIVAVSAYLPLVFAFLRRGLRQGSAGWCAAAGLALGIAALAGHAQMTLILALAGGITGLWELARSLSRRDVLDGKSEQPPPFRVLALIGIWLLTAIGVSAIAVIPAVELTRYTARAQLDYAEASRYSLPPAGLAGFFSPLVFGRGPAGFWAPWERVETGYAGVVTLLLAGIGIAQFASRPLQTNLAGSPEKASADDDRRSLVGLLVAIFLIGLLIALGQHTPLHYLLYRFAPGFSQLRVPARFILLSDFALSALAALGLQAAVRAAVPRKRLVVAAGVLAVAGASVLLLAFGSVIQAAPDAGTPEHQASLSLGLTVYLSTLLAAAITLDRLRLWSLSRPRNAARQSSRIAPSDVFLGLLIVILAADLITLDANTEIEPNDPTVGFNHPQAVAFLKSQPGPTRIDIATGQWAPDAAMRHGLEDIGGISNPLALALYDAYFWSVGYRGSPQYNFLGAQYVVADKGTPPADATFVPVFNEDPAVDIYLNTGSRPRVSLVQRTIQVSDSQSAFEAVHAADFDPAANVVIENGPALPEGQPAGDIGLAHLDYGAERIAVQARTAVTSYLVFAEPWYPGWRATVDGETAPIYRANYAFRAILLEPGDHRVEMVFDPWTWKAGVGVTGLTFIGLLAWAIVQRRGVRARGGNFNRAGVMACSDNP